jgi:hypothetical protein
MLLTLVRHEGATRQNNFAVHVPQRRSSVACYVLKYTFHSWVCQDNPRIPSLLMLWKQRLVCTRILPGNHTCICRDIERPRWVRSTLANRTYRVHPVRVCNCNRSLSQYRGAITGKLFLRRREECFPLFTGLFTGRELRSRPRNGST